MGVSLAHPAAPYTTYYEDPIGHSLGRISYPLFIIAKPIVADDFYFVLG
jgi:hypothetical protein